MTPTKAVAGAGRPGFFIWNIGCQMNAADARRVAELLAAAGFTAVSRAQDADLVVVNSCVVRQQAEDKTVQRLQGLRRLKARRPQAVVILMGCLVGQNAGLDLPRRFPFVDLFIEPSDTERLTAWLVAQGLLEDRVPPPGGQPGAPQGVTGLVPVVLGCSHGCAYCVIPSRRGAERSRPASEIVAEAQALLAGGVRELTLLGQIVDPYGFDCPDGPNLAALLRQVAALPGLRRLRFLTSHPRYITAELIATVAETPRICPQWEIAVQSGSDSILRAMRRGYPAAHFRDLVGRIRAAQPAAAIHTDIIVGFPGETEADFEATRELLADLQLEHVHIAKYSPRPGTPAADLADDVPAPVKEQRRIILETAQREIQTRQAAAWLGGTVEVLVEDTAGGRWRGRTRQNRLCFFTGSAAPGAEVAVRVTWAGPYSLVGEVVGAVGGAA